MIFDGQPPYSSYDTPQTRKHKLKIFVSQTPVWNESKHDKSLFQHAFQINLNYLSSLCKWFQGFRRTRHEIRVHFRAQPCASWDNPLSGHVARTLVGHVSVRRWPGCFHYEIIMPVVCWFYAHLIMVLGLVYLTHLPPYLYKGNEVPKWKLCK